MRAAWDRLEAMPDLASVRRGAEAHEREYLLDMLQWNDRNGCWTDELAALEEMDPASKEEAVQAVVDIIRDSCWRFDDPRRQTDPTAVPPEHPKSWKPRGKRKK